MRYRITFRRTGDFMDVLLSPCVFFQTFGEDWKCYLILKKILTVGSKSLKEVKKKMRKIWEECFE